MADIFISYAREDHATSEKLAAALEAKGYSVWWDRNIESGADFSEEIERELETAKAIIVCWSDHGSHSRWVKDEASIAAEAGKLLALRLDAGLPPIGFRQYHALDFSEWRGGGEATAFQNLTQAIENRLAGASSSTHVAPPKQQTRFSLDPKILIAAGALLGVTLLGFVLLKGGADPQHKSEDDANLAASTATPAPASETHASDDKSVAVLPFENLSNDPEQEYFSDGVAEEILNALTRVDGLRVAGRTSSFIFKGQDKNLSVIGETLSVAHVLGGSVRKQGERVRIRAELVDVANGFSLWSETFERDLNDIFAIQDEIARAVADQMEVIVKTGGRPLVERATENDNAYQLFLSAQARLALIGPENLQAAIDLYLDAVELDPSFARAWAGLSSAYSLAPWYLAAPQSEILAEAERYARRAIELDPSLAEPYAALGIVAVVRQRFDEMRPYFERAIELDPHNLTARQQFAGGLLSVGHVDQAKTQALAAIDIDPIHPNSFFWLAYSEYVGGNLDAAQEAAERAAAFGFPLANFALADIALERGELELARSLAEKGYAEGFSGGLSAAEFGMLAKAGYGGDEQDIESAIAFVDDYMSTRTINRELVIPAALFKAHSYEKMSEIAAVTEAPMFDLFYRLWANEFADARRDPTIHQMLKNAGLVTYWKTYGWPEYCRPTGGDNFECN